MAENIALESNGGDILEWLKGNAAQQDPNTVFVLPHGQFKPGALGDVAKFVNREQGGRPPFAIAKEALEEHGVTKGDVLPIKESLDGSTHLEIKGESFLYATSDHEQSDLATSFTRSRVLTNEYPVPKGASNAVVFSNGKEQMSHHNKLNKLIDSTVNEVSIVGEASDVQRLAGFATSDPEAFPSEMAEERGTPVTDFSGKRRDPAQPHLAA